MKPSHQAEHSLINAIIDGRFPAGTRLPAERELATMLGVTRPTLREILSRLHGDGWLTIRHGKATLVNDYWAEGGLNVLCAIVRSGRPVSTHFVTWLLQVRRDMAPAYTRAAVEGQVGLVTAHLDHHSGLGDDPAAYSTFDWELHRQLTRASGNPVYTLILNGFQELYQQLGNHYFNHAQTREISQDFYATLLEHCCEGRAAEAESLCRQVMEDSIRRWNALTGDES